MGEMGEWKMKGTEGTGASVPVVQGTEAPVPSVPPPLKRQFRTQHDLSRIRNRIRGIRTERRRRHARIRVREVVMVEQIREIPAQLHLKSFAYGNVLREVQIPVLVRRAAERV